MKRVLCLASVVCLTGCASFSRTLGAEREGGNISVTFYAPAWGPNEKGEEVAYFLKQVTLTTSNDEQNRIYLCSIKPDGTGRREIGWLWKDQPDQFLEPYPIAAHLEINAATKRIAIGVEKGARAGIFVVNLDGTKLQQVWPKEWNQNRPTKASYPTWSPDGEWIAFVEWRFEDGYDFREIVKCHPDASGYTALTQRHGYDINIQPAWSPTTNLIAYVNDAYYNKGDKYLWLMDEDGLNKRNMKAWGDYPRWSPDGKRILHSGLLLMDPDSGNRLATSQRFPKLFPKWGQGGFLAATPGGIDFTPPTGEGTRSLLCNTSRPAGDHKQDKEEFRW